MSNLKTKFILEKIDWTKFTFPVIGVDEVGRGCLAGPVYAGAVVLKNQTHDHLLTDSKLLTEQKRNSISKLIWQTHEVQIASASVEEIDEINILQASLVAMKRAVLALGYTRGTVLIDGNQKIPNLVGFEQFTFVKGDLRVSPISAAAICAKVARDNLMIELSVKYPQYELEKHKGYSTKKHKDLIQKWGPEVIHRRSFSGVKEHCQAP